MRVLSTLLYLFAALLLVEAAAIPPEDENFDDGDGAFQTVYSSCNGMKEEMCKRDHTWGQPWECVDTTNDPKNCGGCMNPMYSLSRTGQDCTIIPGQKQVACVESVCFVLECQGGWDRSRDGRTCAESFDEGD